ncbi:hypothetical protein BDV96DRAFT_607704 [Lophiotrema nucula]|uniref:Uncharacterized protein n=1 Tax=Lophiotrema nucula TaxID=690887 RepID=A0A6A5YIU0_9PLEO|nr:hypothetical protein BDV96DRAFT_607704 [Lophiotrema nucula]
MAVPYPDATARRKLEDEFREFYSDRNWEFRVKRAIHSINGKTVENNRIQAYNQAYNHAPPGSKVVAEASFWITVGCPAEVELSQPVRIPIWRFPLGITLDTKFVTHRDFRNSMFCHCEDPRAKEGSMAMKLRMSLCYEWTKNDPAPATILPSSNISAERCATIEVWPIVKVEDEDEAVSFSVYLRRVDDESGTETPTGQSPMTSMYAYPHPVRHKLQVNIVHNRKAPASNADVLLLPRYITDDAGSSPASVKAPEGYNDDTLLMSNLVRRLSYNRDSVRPLADSQYKRDLGKLNSNVFVHLQTLAVLDIRGLQQLSGSIDMRYVVKPHHFPFRALPTELRRKVVRAWLQYSGHDGNQELIGHFADMYSRQSAYKATGSSRLS